MAPSPRKNAFIMETKTFQTDTIYAMMIQMRYINIYYFNILFPMMIIG